MKKTLLIGAIVLLAAGCGNKTPESSPAPVNDQPQQSQNSAPSQPDQNPNIPPSQPATSQNSTDANLNLDLNNIDGQMNGLNNDNASADQSLDQQGQSAQ